MKKIITLLAVISAVTLSSCNELQAVGNVGADFVGTVFEGSIAIDNAVVTSATGVKTRGSITGGVFREGNTTRKIDKHIGTGTQYQTLTIRANGKTYRGNLDYDGERIYSGQRGTLYIGKKTGEFKRFEPTY